MLSNRKYARSRVISHLKVITSGTSIEWVYNARLEAKSVVVIILALSAEIIRKTKSNIAQLMIKTRRFPGRRIGQKSTKLGRIGTVSVSGIMTVRFGADCHDFAIVEGKFRFVVGTPNLIAHHEFNNSRRPQQCCN